MCFGRYLLFFFLKKKQGHKCRNSFKCFIFVNVFVLKKQKALTNGVCLEQETMLSYIIINQLKQDHHSGIIRY